MANVPISSFTVPANTIGIGATGYSLTGSASASFVDLAGTWNTSGTPTAIKLNITNTASNASSLLMDLQTGGTSRFRIDTNGSIRSRAFQGTADLLYVLADDARISIANIGTIGWTAGSAGASADLTLRRRGAANLALGAADAAAPVAQTLSVQSVVAGTTNTPGAEFRIDGSQGTGTGAGGSLVFRVAPAGSSGTAQNALSTALTITSAGLVSITPSSSSASSIHALRGSFSTPAYSFSTDTNSGAFFGALNGLNSYQISIGGFTQWSVAQSNGGTTQSGPVTWAAVSGNSLGTQDVFLYRDAANTLALRNGTAAQAFRVYNTTDGTNSEFVTVAFNSNIAYLSTGASGTGIQRNLGLFAGTGAPIRFWTNGVECWSMSSSGHFNAVNDNTFDIGAAAASRPRNLFLGSYMQMSEMTAPAAPATNGVRIYAEDNGSGKTRLMALFATGAAQQIAIEP